jgi:hypothetical protein
MPNNKTSATRVSFAQWLRRMSEDWLMTLNAVDGIPESEYENLEELRTDIQVARALAAHVEQIQQWADVNPECEVRVSSEAICGKETWYWYPADGGGTMALCEQHAENRAYAKPLPRVWDICHSLAAGFDPNAAIHPEGAAE